MQIWQLQNCKTYAVTFTAVVLCTSYSDVITKFCWALTIILVKLKVYIVWEAGSSSVIKYKNEKDPIQLGSRSSFWNTNMYNSKIARTTDSVQNNFIINRDDCNKHSEDHYLLMETWYKHWILETLQSTHLTPADNHSVHVQPHQKITVLWDVTPCSLVNYCQCFRGMHCLHPHLPWKWMQETTRNATNCQNTRCHNSEDSNLYSHCCETLKSQSHIRVYI
jgi:hypothetical protein